MNRFIFIFSILTLFSCNEAKSVFSGSAGNSEISTATDDTSTNSTGTETGGDDNDNGSTDEPIWINGSYLIGCTMDSAESDTEVNASCFLRHTDGGEIERYPNEETPATFEWEIARDTGETIHSATTETNANPDGKISFSLAASDLIDSTLDLKISGAGQLQSITSNFIAATKQFQGKREDLVLCLNSLSVEKTFLECIDFTENGVGTGSDVTGPLGGLLKCPLNIRPTPSNSATTSLTLTGGFIPTGMFVGQTFPNLEFFIASIEAGVGGSWDPVCTIEVTLPTNEPGTQNVKEIFSVGSPTSCFGPPSDPTLLLALSSNITCDGSTGTWLGVSGL